MKRKKPKETAADDAFTTEILALLKVATGVDFTDYKHTTISRRIQKRLVANKISSLKEYVDLLRSRPVELPALCREILINVTRFFRDPEVFDALETLIFPRILEERSPDDAIRVWVPGCSSGEEVYSLAIALIEFISRRNQRHAIQIFATDISDSVLEIARSGVYPASISSVVSPQRMHEFFAPIERGYQIKKSLRDLCVFARQNVIADPPLPRLDLISCRNLLIYFGPALQEKIVPIFHFALKPTNGFLILGKSELVDIFSDFFLPVDKIHKFYVKKATPSRVSLHSLVFKSSIRVNSQIPTTTHISTRDTEAEVQMEADRLILSTSSPSAVIVTENMDIVQFRGRMSPYLAPSGRASLNLLRMVRPELLSPLRNALEQAKAEQTRSVRCKQIRYKMGARVKFVNIRVIPIKGSTLRQRYFLIVFKRSKPPSGRIAHSTIETQNPGGPEVARLSDAAEIRQLTDDLEETKRQLQAAVDERELTVEELQSSNEEVTSSNEELQAMNQELEIAKEELESSNEELTTLNEQLRHNMDQLKKTEERFRLLVTGVKDYAIFTLDQKGHILSWNEGAERIKGYSAQEIVGKHFSVFYRDEERRAGKPEKELDIAISAGRFEDEGIRVRKDGSEFWASVIINPLFDEERNFYGFAKVTRDITERKIANEKLHEIEESFQNLIQGVKDYAIFILDRHGYVKTWNEGAQRIKGYTADEIIGQHFSKFYPREDVDIHKPEYLLNRVAASGRLEDEGWRIRKDGSRFWANVVITALRDKNGQIVGYSKITRDITERRDREVELEARVRERTAALLETNQQLARTNAELEQFAYVASHDLQEPLRMVSTYLQFVEKRAKDGLDAETRRFIDFAIEGAVRLRSLVGDLLAFSRVGDGLASGDKVDVNTIVAEAKTNLKSVIEENGATISVGDLPSLNVDHSQMVQVFQNLISNAIKYRSDALPQIQIKAEETENEWVFSVQDNGIGIDPEYHEKIFVVFQRLHSDRQKYPGTGIGLAICKKIIERHRGRIWVHSKPNEGSVFYFTVPRLV
jgi:two-component system CheB/CheR fusion protein